MPLSSALVDRARLIVRTPVMSTDATPVAIKVEGRVRFEGGGSVSGDEPGPPPGPWFACRITELETQNQLQNGRSRLPRKIELLFSITDEAGGPVVLRSDAQIEVESELGNEVYQVDSKPEIFRRKRGFVGGGLASCSRVNEAPDVRAGA